METVRLPFLWFYFLSQEPSSNRSIYLRFPGDPNSEHFRHNVPLPSAARTTLVGRVVPPLPDAPMAVDGWRAFDVRSVYYHSEKKRRIPFTTRWYLPASPQWAKIRTPGVGTLLELSGDLLGRHEDVYSSETFAPLAIEIHHMEFLSVQQFGAKSADPVSAPQSQSSPSRSPWGRSIPPPPLPSSTTQAAEGCDFDSPAGLSEKAKGKRKASGLYTVDDSSSYVQVAASFSSPHTPDHQLAQSSASQFSANTRAGPSPDPVMPTPIRSSKRQRHHSRTLRGNNGGYLCWRWGWRWAEWWCC